MVWKIILWALLAISALFVAYILLIVVSSLFVDKTKEYKKNSKYFRFLLNSSTALAVKVIRIQIKVTGKDKLPKGRFLLVSNHRSKFDPILTWHIFAKHNLAFISKFENFDVPIYGNIIKKCCFMGIDRENPRKAAKTIINSVELIQSDECSVAVYPEGTRNYGDGLLPFHNMVFKIAKRAEVPVVVLAVRGTYDIQKNFPKRKSVVNMDVVSVLSTETVKELSTAELGETVRKAILLKTEGTYE